MYSTQYTYSEVQCLALSIKLDLKLGIYKFIGNFRILDPDHCMDLLSSSMTFDSKKDMCAGQVLNARTYPKYFFNSTLNKFLPSPHENVVNKAKESIEVGGSDACQVLKKQMY